MSNTNEKMKINMITLSFPNEVEGEFQNYFFLDSLPYFRIAFLIVTFLYGAFSFLDSLRAIEHLQLFYIIRFFIVIPFLFTVFFLSYFNLFKKIWQLLLVASFLLGGIGIITMVVTIPDEASYYGGLMLVLFSGYFFIKLRFIFATVCGWGLIVIFNVGAIWYSNIHTDLLVSYNFFFIAANIISMVASYYIELFYRRNYWLTKNLEIKSFELELALGKEKAINDLRSRFIATVSHEFRTPLTAILSSSELLHRYSDRFDQAKKTMYFQNIASRVEHLTRLLDDMMLISRADREVLKNNPEQLDLLEQFAIYLEEHKSIISNNHKIKIDNNLNITKIYVDKKLLHHIFSNLIGNSIKYSPNGGEVNIKITRNSEQLVVEISDQGIGIPEDEIGHIFDPFYRSKNTTEIGGTGLGLNVAKRAVKVLGGIIEIKNTSTKGTTFLVKIPDEAIS